MTRSQLLCGSYGPIWNCTIAPVCTARSIFAGRQLLCGPVHIFSKTVPIWPCGPLLSRLQPLYGQYGPHFLNVIVVMDTIQILWRIMLYGLHGPFRSTFQPFHGVHSLLRSTFPKIWAASRPRPRHRALLLSNASPVAWAAYQSSSSRCR